MKIIPGSRLDRVLGIGLALLFGAGLLWLLAMSVRSGIPF